MAKQLQPQWQHSTDANTWQQLTNAAEALHARQPAQQAQRLSSAAIITHADGWARTVGDPSVNQVWHWRMRIQHAQPWI